MPILHDILDDAYPKAFIEMIDNDYLYDIYTLLSKVEHYDASVLRELDDIVKLPEEERQPKIAEIVMKINSMLTISEAKEEQEEIYI